MKILILEDDIELSLAMKQELLRNDYMVDCCHDGETGLLYALNAEFGYDLAIVDRMLPVIDGLTIIKAMRKSGRSILLRSMWIRCLFLCMKPMNRGA